MASARFILDTNVLVSRLLIPRSVAGLAVSRLLHAGQPLVSEATLKELAQTLTRDKFNPYVSLEDRQEFFRLFARVAEWVPVTTTLRVCREPNDNKFLELAVDGQASLIVTGDKDLLALSPFRTVTIVTPAEVLDMPDSVLSGETGDVP